MHPDGKRLFSSSPNYNGGTSYTHVLAGYALSDAGVVSALASTSYNYAFTNYAAPGVQMEPQGRFFMTNHVDYGFKDSYLITDLAAGTISRASDNHQTLGIDGVDSWSSDGKYVCNAPDEVSRGPICFSVDQTTGVLTGIPSNRTDQQKAILLY